MPLAPPDRGPANLGPDGPVDHTWPPPARRGFARGPRPCLQSRTRMLDDNGRGSTKRSRIDGSLMADAAVERLFLCRRSARQDKEARPAARLLSPQRPPIHRSRPVLGFDLWGSHLTSALTASLSTIGP